MTTCPKCAREVTTTRYGRCVLCGLEIAAAAAPTKVPWVYDQPWLRLGVAVTAGMSLIVIGLFARALWLEVELPWPALGLPAVGLLLLAKAWAMGGGWGRLGQG